MNNLINNPGFSHITKKILNILDNKDQLLCRSGIWLVVSIFMHEKTIFHISFFAVCQSLKTHVDQPIFWTQKLDHEGQSDTGSPHFTRFHFTRFTLYTTFRKITSLLVKSTQYIEKNCVKQIFILLNEIHVTLFTNFTKHKNSVMWGRVSLKNQKSLEFHQRCT